MCLHASVSLNNEKICREFSEHKIAVCEKTAGLLKWELFGFELSVFETVSSGRNISVLAEISQFSDMHYETERHR